MRHILGVMVLAFAAGVFLNLIVERFAGRQQLWQITAQDIGLWAAIEGSLWALRKREKRRRGGVYVRRG